MKLSDFLKENDMSAAKFGELVGASRQKVFRWLSGNIPRREHMNRIGEATGGQVQPNDFYREDEAAPHREAAE